MKFYFKNLLLGVGLMMAMAGMLSFVPLFEKLLFFIWFSLFFLVLVSVFTFYLWQKALLTEHQKQFTTFFFGGMGINFLFTILFLFSWALITKPEGYMYLGPYTLIFVVLKFVEVFSLLKVDKERKRTISPLPKN